MPVSVLNSHTHNDHVGDNWEFQGVHLTISTAWTLTSPAKVRKARVTMPRQRSSQTSFAARCRSGFDANGRMRPGHSKSRTGCTADDTIDLGGRLLKVITTPGHTPDSISLLDQAHGLLFTGDTYYPGLIYLYRPETDLAAL